MTYKTPDDGLAVHANPAGQDKMPLTALAVRIDLQSSGGEIDNRCSAGAAPEEGWLASW